MPGEVTTSPQPAVPMFPPAGPLKRPEFLQLFADIRPILEISPFDKPMVVGPGVSYFEILDQAGLIERAKKNPNRNGTVPFIEFVSPIGDLSIVNRRFAAVCSSHCIEHQPDVIKHLTDVGRILENGGYYFLAVPDKRYCFDHFSPESSVADVIEAQGRTRHTLGSVIKTTGLATHNDARRHWKGDHKDPDYDAMLPERIQRAIKIFEDSDGGYVDAHAWRFTPQTFGAILSTLHTLDMSPLRVARVYATGNMHLEFLVILQKD